MDIGDQIAARASGGLMPDIFPDMDTSASGEGGLDFLWNLLDIVNLLQHIPVVLTIYRELTGDEVSAPARLIGGAIFGDPAGLASASANLAIEDATGLDIGGHATALINGTTWSASPELAATITPPATPPTAAISQQLAGGLVDGDEIVWNAPRVVPQRIGNTDQMASWGRRPARWRTR